MWDDIYANLAMATGWTWEYIDTMVTIPILMAFNHYWKSCPPVHQMVAHYLGYYREKEEKKNTFEDFVRDFTAQGGHINGIK